MADLDRAVPDDFLGRGIVRVRALVAWAAAVAFDKVSWADHLAQAKRWMGASLGEPAPAKLAKQDDLPG